VSMTISGAPLPPVGQLGRQFPYGQGAAAAAVAEEEDGSGAGEIRNGDEDGN
jgi:hypothetical protein